MKNKNNVTATELVDLICKVRKESYNDSGTAYAYAVGTLQAIIDNALWSSDKNYLQNSINNSYEHFMKELVAGKEQEAADEFLIKSVDHS